jgi:plasmid maintenance system antidote protein VapI
MRYENKIQRIAGIVNPEFAFREYDGETPTHRQSGSKMFGMRYVRTSELDTFGGRAGWLLRTRRYKQIDLANGLNRSPASVSEIVNNKKEFDWGTTARMVTFLKTNADFFLGLTEDDSMVAVRDGNSADMPTYKYEETDRTAQIVDNSPEWLRLQMLAVVQAQYDAYLDSLQEAQDEEWTDRLRNAIAVSGLIVGEERTRTFVSQLESIILDAAQRKGRGKPTEVVIG